MAFWGIELKPGKPYTHMYNHEQGRLHLSQATLGNGSSTKKTIVQCNVGDKKPIYLCSLLPEKLETCPLNHEFEEEDEVTFSVIGPHAVHLSGFFYGESHDNCDSDSYGEDIGESDSEDESSEYDSEDEFDDGFIVDDTEMYPSSPIPNSGVRIEEILDEEKPANENGLSKQSKKKKKHQNKPEQNEKTDQQVIVRSGGAPILESEDEDEDEDEDGLPVSAHAKSNTNDHGTTKSEEVKEKRADEEAKGKKEKDEPSRVKASKRKVDDNEHASEETEMVPENDGKKRRNKKKKVGGEGGKILEGGSTGKTAIQTEAAIIDKKVVDGDNDAIVTENRSNEKKKNKRKSKNQEIAASANVAQTLTEKNGSMKAAKEKDEGKPFQVRSFPNGLTIEELRMGKPDAKRAAPGKKVSVHYIGKLQKNGKIFDSNIGKAAFKFRLGIGQVIKGWDVGVNGMRVGDKRRLIVPPAMGYGSKGAGGTIPPNATLVFDVELVGVN